MYVSNPIVDNCYMHVYTYVHMHYLARQVVCSRFIVYVYICNASSPCHLKHNSMFSKLWKSVDLICISAYDFGCME